MCQIGGQFCNQDRLLHLALPFISKLPNTQLQKVLHTSDTYLSTTSLTQLLLKPPKCRMETATATKLCRRKNVNSWCCTVIDGIGHCCSRENQCVCSREVTSLQQEQELTAAAPSQSCRESRSWAGTQSRAGPAAGGQTAKVGKHTDRATLRGGGSQIVSKYCCIPLHKLSCLALVSPFPSVCAGWLCFPVKINFLVTPPPYRILLICLLTFYLLRYWSAAIHVRTQTPLCS